MAERKMLALLTTKMKEQCRGIWQKTAIQCRCFLPKDYKEMSKQPCSQFLLLESKIHAK